MKISLCSCSLRNKSNWGAGRRLVIMWGKLNSSENARLERPNLRIPSNHNDLDGVVGLLAVIICISRQPSLTLLAAKFAGTRTRFTSINGHSVCRIPLEILVEVSSMLNSPEYDDLNDTHSPCLRIGADSLRNCRMKGSLAFGGSTAIRGGNWKAPPKMKYTRR